MAFLEHGSGCLSPEQRVGYGDLSGDFLAMEVLGGWQVPPFSLLQIPMAVPEISSAQHPVKAGLSDAFMILNSSPEVPGESAYRDLCSSHFSLSYDKCLTKTI